MRGSPLRVCYFGTYRATYNRNRLMIEGLRRSGVEVIECHAHLWQGIEDREKAVGGGWKNPRFWVRIIWAYVHLLWRYVKVGRDYDILFVGYPGQFDVYLARLLSWWRRKPLAWDLLVSIRLIASERGLAADNPGIVRWIGLLERTACLLPDLLAIDTCENGDWITQTYALPPGLFTEIPIGTDISRFHPLPPPADNGTFRVLYYGTFIPNHGVPVIVEAARLLADTPDIRFDLIGRGPDRAKAEELARTYGLSNVRFVDWLSHEELQEEIANANLCLGAFGTRPQSLLTVHNKVFECMALARPVLTGRGPSVQRMAEEGRQIFLCDPGSPASLAQAVRDLSLNPRLCRRIAEGGRRLVEERFTVEEIGKLCAEQLGNLLTPTSSSTVYREPR